MKKATTRSPADPSARTLREMPEVDFSRYRVRRNRYAARIAREGVHVVHDAPSRASLEAMPEADFTRARVGRNPYASRAAETRLQWQYGRGRPVRGQELGPTEVRSLRLPARVWESLDRHARGRKTTTHALLRELVALFLEREGSR